MSQPSVERDVQTIDQKTEQVWSGCYLLYCRAVSLMGQRRLQCGSSSEGAFLHKHKQPSGTKQASKSWGRRA